MVVESKILVVDDNPSNLKLTSELLCSAGYAVSSTISGERALTQLQHYRPDLILLDVQMPGIDGFETCKHIKSKPDTAHIPIIFTTAFSDIGHIARGFSLGAIDYVTKPVQELELLTRVRTHLKLSQVHRSLEQQVADRTEELEQALLKLQVAHLLLADGSQPQTGLETPTVEQFSATVLQCLHRPVGEAKKSISAMKPNLTALIAYFSLHQRLHQKLAQTSEPSQIRDAQTADMQINVLLETIGSQMADIERSYHTLSETVENLEALCAMRRQPNAQQPPQSLEVVDPEVIRSEALHSHTRHSEALHSQALHSQAMNHVH